MAYTSRTGLLESTRKTIPQLEKVTRHLDDSVSILNRANLALEPVELSCSTKRAPFVLRPFAGLYNPFSYGCSILCNHPADAEIKDVVRRAKDALILDGKNDINDETDTVQATLGPTERKENCVDFVQEELFRRYTDTDSRPLTPAPTLASAVSRSSMKRRCLTPDHPPAPKQTLILDLRRSHSQETLFWHGFHTSDLSSGLGLSSEDTNNTSALNCAAKKYIGTSLNQMPPLVSPARLTKRSPLQRGNVSDRSQRPIQKTQVKVLQASKTTSKVEKPQTIVVDEETVEDEELETLDCEEELPIMEGGDIRRRGKRRKGRNRLASAALIATTQNDPETQIAGIGSESHNPSSRESVVANEEDYDDVQSSERVDGVVNKYPDSFLQPDLLEYLHREVDLLAIETEFDEKRRIVLQEAYRTRSDKTYGKEMQTVLKEVQLPPVNLNKWLHIPRIYSRRNATFSLPIDRRQFESLSPMQYVSDFVKVTNSKKLLYRIVLEEFDKDSVYIRTDVSPEQYLSFNGSESKMRLQNIVEGLQSMMGENVTEEQLKSFVSLIKWDELTDEQLDSLVEKTAIVIEEMKNNEINDAVVTENSDDLFAEFDVADSSNQKKEEVEENHRRIHFRTWCGLCSLCERLYAPFPPVTIDPPHEVEAADFDTLQGKLMTQKIDESLSEILISIQNSHQNNK